MNYPMDMFEEGLSGRQLETSLRFEEPNKESQEKKPSSAELIGLLKGKRAELKTLREMHLIKNGQKMLGKKCCRRI